jgi:hypothetical protein
MREQLIRYLLGELDANERRELRARLEADPELQLELEQLRSCVASNHEENDDEFSPPSSLAERTARQVKHCNEENYEALAACSHRSSASDPPAGVLGWSLADLTVAGGVMLAVSMLVFPALRDSRDGTRLTMCEHNLQQIQTLGARFAEDHFGYLPPVLPNEPAGIYAARLVDAGVAEPDQLAIWLLCPASPLADEIRAGRAKFQIPDRGKLRVMQADQLLEVTATLSPCYAYRLPHKSGDGFSYLSIYPRRRLEIQTPEEQPAFEPVLSDDAGDSSGVRAGGHRGNVFLVAGLDGSVRRFRADGQLSLEADQDMFRNDVGIVAAGLRPQDVVLGSGHSKPGLDMVSQGK